MNSNHPSIIDKNKRKIKKKKRGLRKKKRRLRKKKKRGYYQVLKNLICVTYMKNYDFYFS